MKYELKPKEPAAESEKTEVIHKIDCPCSLCGTRYHNIAFKGGYVCETCINYIRNLT